MRYITMLFALLAFALASCASQITKSADPVAGVIAKVSKLPKKDATSQLKAAYDYAVANGDVTGAQCWAGLPPCIAQIQALLQPPVSAPTAVVPDASGNPALALEEIRVAKASLDATAKQVAASLLAANVSGQLGQIRQCINLACGALWIDINASLADPLGLFSGIAPK